ncbi:hypothetical protein CO038_04385 [Candidatus Pacearchaeota archaeon CG_4_9_14_0_2_um_filter_39_13]|nr:hypothetical protein [Candidatus Pacearchaeota archaeon]PJC44306.1 MAG: hypothetical protein CO038_04385 [Candidatus Pacearchaeota archaeon CG_4_9_14_0_2_um_filter_39_13]
MAIGVIESFALIVAAVSIIKLVFLVVNRGAWLKFAKSLYSTKGVAWIFGILSLVVLYYLMQTLTIVQIFAVTLFYVFFLGMAFTSYSNDFIKLAEKMIKSKFPAIVWIFSIIWLALSVWVIYIIFA